MAFSFHRPRTDETSGPQLLQARWVLDGVAPEEWVNHAISALDQGFDGTALRNLRDWCGPLDGT